MRTSYSEQDVTMLLKDITGMVEPLDNAERERRIQSGVHYSEMLPKESLPSEVYKRTFLTALERYAAPTAKAAECIAERILAEKGRDVVLVSLARAGTPIGILLRRYLKQFHGIDAPHYTISIIRGRGIDKNAMRYLLDRYEPKQIQFIDGWTGKGAIRNQLREAMQDFPGVDDRVAVLSDPAGVTPLCGTHEDFLIPSSCLNSTVSGLISRTFCRSDIIGEDDFHGAMYYEAYESADMSNLFLDTVQAQFGCDYIFPEEAVSDRSPIAEVEEIARHFGIADINFVKPGIGETTRVLLRRIPWKILVHSLDDTAFLGHIYQLAEEKQIELEVYPFRHYRACGLIKNLADT
ncbi:MAG: cysteine protease StiP family protein [Oscillospiraceae bacterium]|nr:cysteine protease StiP family protein [Oscillospiraceae bacterium]